LALENAALGGHFNWTIRLLNSGAENDDVHSQNDYILKHITYALYGAARGGHFEMVIYLLDLAKTALTAIWGEYAPAVQYYLPGGDPYLNAALKEAASGGHFGIVNYLVAKSADINAALEGFKATGILITHNNDCMVKNLSLINNEKLRQFLVKQLKEHDPLIDNHHLLSKTKKFNRMLNEYPLAYYKQKSLTIMNARVWLMQGRELVEALSEDIFFRITYFVIGLPTKEAKQVYNAITYKLFLDVNAVIIFKFFNSNDR